MTSKLKFRLEYLWRSCCCDIASQSDLFRLTYATELLKDLGWDSVVLSDEGKQINSVEFWALGDKAQFSEVIKQHHLCGQFDENLPHYID